MKTFLLLCGISLSVSYFNNAFSQGMGIGIAAPISVLHMYENTANVGTTTGFTIEQNGAGDAVTQYLLTGGQRWVSGIDNSDGDKYKISSAADLGSTTRFTIMTTGNTGIGIATPVSMFHVYENTGNTSTTAGFTVEQNGAGDAVVQYLLTGGQRWMSGVDNSDGDKFKISSNTDLATDARLTIQTNGNVAIGPATATQKLTIGSDGVNAKPAIARDVDNNALEIMGGSSEATGAYFQITGQTHNQSPGRSSAEFVIGDDTDATFPSKYSLYSYDEVAAAWTERFRVMGFTGNTHMGLSGGLVGVGLDVGTTPLAQLHVGGTGNIIQSANAYQNFGATSGTTGYGFRDNAGTMEYKNNGGAWASFSTAGTAGWTDDGTVVRLTTVTDQVGIGTATPTAGSKLDVRGAAIFNEDGGDNDFRIEGDNNANLFFADAGVDRIGIGTNTPNTTLDVRGSATFNEDGGNNDFRIEGDNNQNLFVADASADMVGIGTATPGATLDVRGSATFNDDGGNNDFRIEGDNIANLFFTDAGNDRVGIGLNNPAYRLDVLADQANGYAANFFNDGGNANRYGIRIQAGADNAGGTTYYVRCYDGDASEEIGNLQQNGGNFSLQNVSDIRRKTNVKNTVLAGLDIVNKIRVVDYNMKTTPDGITHHGFIAQELDDVYPYMVHENEEGLLTINQTALIPVLIKAVQEQQKIIDELRQTVSEVKNGNNSAHENIENLKGEKSNFRSMNQPK